MARRTRSCETPNATELVIATFNCEKWKSPIIKSLIEELSENHTKNIIVALQETWKYDIPKLFKREFGNRYSIIHETAMSTNEPRKRGRPFGGLCLIISKDISFQVKYTNCRCLSLLLIEHNILLNNIYLPFNDSRINSEENYRNMAEALGHLDAAHEITTETSNYITLVDFNYAPSDVSQRVNAVKSLLETHGYRNSDLNHLSSTDFSHRSGRLLDRFVTTEFVNNSIKDIYIKSDFLHSDHYAVVAKLCIKIDQHPAITPQNTSLAWKRALEKAEQVTSKEG